MTKRELIDTAVKVAGIELTKRDAMSYFNAVISTIGTTIKKEKRLAIADLGVFTLVKRKARKGRNPQTGEKIKIKASKSIKYRVAASLKKSL